MAFWQFALVVYASLANIFFTIWCLEPEVVLPIGIQENLEFRAHSPTPTSLCGRL
jgi:hypothetical protein